MQQKAAIVFYSVCGNTYLLGKMFQEAFTQHGVAASLFRAAQICPPDGWAAGTDSAREMASTLESVPVFSDITKMDAYDYIVLGSPTYFGNVAGPMKAFMDLFAYYWAGAGLYGKRFGAFATAGTIQGGGDLCLHAFQTFAHHLGMLPIPTAVPAPGATQPAYGILHAVGGDANIRPGEDVRLAIGDYVQRMTAL